MIRNELLHYFQIRKIGTLVVLFFVFYNLGLSQTRDSLAKNPKMFLQVASKHLKWNEPTEPLKIASNLYFVGTKGLSAWLITTTEGHILLYTGMPSSGPLIEKSIEKLKFNPKDIKYILTSHAHIDHAGGHAYIKKISGAKVAFMREEVDLYQSGGKLDFHYGSVSDFYFEPTKVDIVLTDGDVIKLGEIVMKALHTPGHTKGSTTWVMDITENGKVYNVVFPDGTSINPGYRVSENPSYAGINHDFHETLHTLEMLKPDIWSTSHTETFGFEEKSKRAKKEGINAWVDPEGYRQFVASQRQNFEDEVTLEKQEVIKSKKN